MIILGGRTNVCKCPEAGKLIRRVWGQVLETQRSRGSLKVLTVDPDLMHSDSCRFSGDNE